MSIAISNSVNIINNKHFSDLNIKDIATIYDPINRKIIVAYFGYANNESYGFVMVGDIIYKDNTIKFGNKIIFNEGVTKNISMAYDFIKGKVIIAFTDGSNSDYGTAIVGTVFNNTIDFSDKVVFNNSSTGYITMTHNSTHDKVIIVFSDNNSRCSMATLGTINNDTIEFNKPVMFNNSLIHNASMIYDAYNGKLVVAYADTNNLNYGTIKTGTLVNGTIEFSDPIVFNNDYTDYINMKYDYDTKAIYITFSSKYPLLEGIIIIAKIINDEIVFASKTTFNNKYTKFISSVFVYDKNKLIIAYCNDSINEPIQSVITVADINNYNIKISKPVVFANNYSDNIFATYDSFNKKIIIGYSEYNESNGKFNGNVAVVNINNLIARI